MNPLEGAHFLFERKKFEPLEEYRERIKSIMNDPNNTFSIKMVGSGSCYLEGSDIGYVFSGENKEIGIFAYIESIHP